MWSRQGTDLTRYFPELVAAAATQVPGGFVLDREAVVWSQGWLDFDALQQRMTTSKENWPRSCVRARRPSGPLICWRASAGGRPIKVARPVPCSGG
jgi:hypothetical protein